MRRKSSRFSSTDPDTLVAVASPPGRGLRAVVRLTGPRAARLAGGLPGAVTMRAPRTYTREDVVEIHLPGSPPLVGRLVRELVRRGARPARPGEFTLRAFLNGRLDLAQAEAVGRIVSSEDEDDRRAALLHLEGAFSRRVREVETAVLDLAADAEASLDFPEEDIEILSAEDAAERGSAARDALRALLAETAARRVADERPTVLLAGPPNAGKSTLFNALTGADALVTPEAGTTRDLLSEELDVGIPVRLLDAPGRREARGIEGEAIRRAREAERSADAVLWVEDATAIAEEAAPTDRPVLRILNKCDLSGGGERKGLRVSALRGEGLEPLKRALAALLGAGEGPAARFRVSLRQHALLREAETALTRACRAKGMEFLALDLRAALAALGGITGRDAEEDLLDRIFSRFCLGK